MATEKFACVDDIEREGQSQLTSWYVDYFSTGSNEEVTLRDCRQSFQRYRLRPRILRDVSVRDLSSTVQGQRISFPVCIAPTALHLCATPEGEKATVKAARNSDTLMVQSMISNVKMADIAMTAPSSLRWMNIYILKRRDIMEHFVREAERCGYAGIVVTLDSPLLGNHFRTARRRMYSIQDTNFKISNFDIEHIPYLQEAKKKDPILISTFKLLISDSPCVEDLRWLKQLTKLPIICKGILTGESARQLAEVGVDGIMVSAHGGRQLDHIPAPIDVLPEVVEAVRGFPVEVYMDGGVRTGTDVFKALARGARAVFVGRPILWGLAHNGEQGATQVLEILREELSLAMALAGCTRLSDIKPTMVVHESYYYNSKL